MKLLSILFILFISNHATSQEITVSTVVPLDGAVWETSGLIWLEDRLITHNDSGGGHYLYEIDTVDGEVMRTVIVANAATSDWEDICYDADYIYVGDFGNNAGTRTDLRIFRISITDYLTTPTDTVYCDTIAFNYADQVDFEPGVYTTNYDAEAFIAYNDSLYLFSKNWGNLETNVYSIPKEPGDYTVSIIDNFDTDGLVTGAAYDAEKNEILLCGYNFITPFLFFIKGFSGTEFSEADLLRVSPSFEGSFQIEGVTALGNHSFFVSSEKVDTGGSFLHRVNVSNFAGTAAVKAESIRIYPKRVTSILRVSGDQVYKIQIFNAYGQLVLSASGNEINMSSMQRAAYYVNVLNMNNEVLLSDKIIKM
ncbi:MAG: hypothetical protein GQ574_11265 [Crocinitomix sp.]|nr:hypothetical protein [Crocinitomix sp.]